MLYATGTLQALTCFEGNNDWNDRTIWSCATSLNRARPKSKPDCVIQLNCRGLCTYAICETTSNIGELQLPRSIKNASSFRLTMADYICSSAYFVASFQIETFITKWRNICIYVYKTTSRFASACKYKLIQLLTFIFAQRYLPRKKQPINLLTQSSKFSNFSPVKNRLLHWFYLLLQRKNLSE